MTVRECIKNIDKYRRCRVIIKNAEYYVYDTYQNTYLLLVSNNKSKFNVPFEQNHFYSIPLLQKASSENWKFFRWLSEHSDLKLKLKLLDNTEDIFPLLEDFEYINKLLNHLNLTLKSYDNT